MANVTTITTVVDSTEYEFNVRVGVGAVKPDRLLTADEVASWLTDCTESEAPDGVTSFSISSEDMTGDDE